MSNAFKQMSPGGKPLSTDLNQIVQSLSGQIDVGVMSLFAPIANPAAPTAAVSAQTGNLNGSYAYIQVNVTGWVGSDGAIYVSGFAPSVASTAVTPVNQQVSVTMAAGPSGTIGRLLYRTAAGGAVYEFDAWIPDNTTTTYTDNLADASLGTGMPSVNGTAIPANVPTSNTTGTFLGIPNLTAQPAVGPSNVVCIVNSQFYISDGTKWVAMAPPLNAATPAALGTVQVVAAPASGNPIASSALVDTKDMQLTATTATIVATYTPAASGNFLVLVYFRVVTAATNVTIDVTYTDATGAQVNHLLPLTSEAVGSHSLVPLFINSVAGQPITVTITAGTANQVYASASILGV